MLYQLQRETNARILLIYIFIMQMYKMLKLALYHFNWDTFALQFVLDFDSPKYFGPYYTRMASTESNGS